MNTNNYSTNTGTSVYYIYYTPVIGYNGTTTSTTTGTQYPNIAGSSHGVFAIDSYTNGNITVPYEMIKLMTEEIKKLSNREREVINNHELINKLVKENKIKITIEIPEEEMI